MLGKTATSVVVSVHPGDVPAMGSSIRLYSRSRTVERAYASYRYTQCRNCWGFRHVAPRCDAKDPGCPLCSLNHTCAQHRCPNISRNNTLHSVCPRSPCAPDVPGAYKVNCCSGCIRPGSFRLEVKGPRPMRPDTDLHVRTHWMWPFLRPNTFDPPWRSHPPDTLPPAPSLFIPSLPMHPFPCCPFADILRPRHLSSQPPPPIPPPASYPSMIPSLL